MQSDLDRKNKAYTRFQDGRQAIPADLHASQIVLRLKPYMDDFLYNSKKESKLCCVYFTLDNLPIKYQTQRSGVHLLLVAKRKFITNSKDRGLHRFFAPLIKDLIRLRRSGFSLGYSYGVKGYVVACPGDNEATNEQAGYPRSFSGPPACKYCYLTYSELQDPDHFDYIYEKGHRDLPTYQKDEETRAENESIMDRNRSNPSEHHPEKERSKSVFRRVQRSKKLFTFDSFHDIVEGLLKDFLNFWKRKFVDKPAKIEKLNIHLLSLKKEFKNADSSFRLNHKYTIDFKGALLLEFFLKLRMIDRDIPPESDFWKLHIILFNIHTFTQATKFYESMFASFINLVKSYMQLLLQNKLTITFKCHHLLHYPDMIRDFGPIFLYDTKYGERGHQNHKKWSGINRNTSNISLSLCRYYVERRAVQKLLPKNQVFRKRSLIWNLVDDEFKPFLNPNLTVKSCVRITYQSINFRIGFLFAIRFGSYFRLIKCLQIFTQAKNYIIICAYLEITNYLTDLCAFSFMETENLVSIDVEMLYASRNLSTIVLDGQRLILNDFHYNCIENNMLTDQQPDDVFKKLYTCM